MTYPKQYRHHSALAPLPFRTPMTADTITHTRHFNTSRNTFDFADADFFFAITSYYDTLTYYYQQTRAKLRTKKFYSPQFVADENA